MTMQDEFEKEFTTNKKFIRHKDRMNVKAWLKGAEARAKIELLKRLLGIYASYTWGHYDPFKILHTEISRLKAEIKK